MMARRDVTRDRLLALVDDFAGVRVAALGGNAIAIGVAGDDEPGRRLLESMRPRIDVRNVVTHKALTTPTKTRILAGGVHSAKQQVVRVDRAARAPIPETVR